MLPLDAMRDREVPIKDTFSRRARCDVYHDAIANSRSRHRYYAITAAHAQISYRAGERWRPRAARYVYAIFRLNINTRQARPPDLSRAARPTAHDDTLSGACGRHEEIARCGLPTRVARRRRGAPSFYRVGRLRVFQARDAQQFPRQLRHDYSASYRC